MPPRVKNFSVPFPERTFNALTKGATAARMYKAKYIVFAVESFLELYGDDPIPEPPSHSPPPVEPSLASTEAGFRMGVEAACEAIAKNTRLNAKMATGMTMGQDMALRIKKDLLG